MSRIKNPQKQPQNGKAGKKAGDIVSQVTANHFFPIILLALLCSALYINSLSNGFVYDDYAIIVENESIQHPVKSLPSFFNTSYFKIARGEASYRPVATLSYYVIHAVAGLNPFWYHLFSVILHMANAILVYLLANVILKDRLAALIAGALFACHPALTEAVDCISYNEDLLAAFFFFLAIQFYFKIRSPDLRPGGYCYALSLVCFLLGLLSKEMAITLPAIILLYDLSFKNEAGNQSFSLRMVLNTIKDKKLVYSGYLAVSLFYLSLRFLIISNPAESIKPYFGSLIDRIMFLPGQIFSFIKLSVFPVNLTAEYVFSYPQHFFAVSNLAGFLFIVGSVVLSFYVFKQSRGLFFAIWWFFITLFPVYNLIPIYNPIAERYLYIPLVGFCMAVSIVFKILMAKRLSGVVPVRILSSVAMIVILGLYATGTISRNRVWKDNFTLWSKTVIDSPNSSIARGSLGKAYQDQGRLEEAIREYEKAIEISPSNFKAYHNLGVLYEGQGELRKAVANYKSAIAINPAFSDARFNLANIYHKQGILSEAIYHFRKVTELDPADFEARNNLGVAYARQGNIEQALAEWQKVLEIDPHNESAAANIGKAKEMMK